MQQGSDVAPLALCVRFSITITITITTTLITIICTILHQPSNDDDDGQVCSRVVVHHLLIHFHQHHRHLHHHHGHAQICSRMVVFIRPDHHLLVHGQPRRLPHRWESRTPHQLRWRFGRPGSARRCHRLSYLFYKLDKSFDAIFLSRMRSGMGLCQEDPLLGSLRNRDMKHMRNSTASCQVHLKHSPFCPTDQYLIIKGSTKNKFPLYLCICCKTTKLQQQQKDIASNKHRSSQRRGDDEFQRGRSPESEKPHVNLI